MVEDKWNNQLLEGVFAKASWAWNFSRPVVVILCVGVSILAVEVLCSGRGRGW